MRGDVGAASVLERSRLERAAGLVEGPPQRRDRHASAGGRPHTRIRRDQGDSRLTRDRDGVVGSGPDHGAQERPGRGRRGRDQRRHARTAQVALQSVLGRGRVGEREDQHGRLGLDPERPQAAAELLRVEPAGERVGQQVAGQPPLGLVHDALSHQLEADDDRSLAGEEALELAERSTFREHGEPPCRRGAATARNRNDEGTVRQRLGLERGGAGATRAQPAGDLLRDPDYVVRSR